MHEGRVIVFLCMPHWLQPVLGLRVECSAAFQRLLGILPVARLRQLSSPLSWFRDALHALQRNAGRTLAHAQVVSG